MILFLSNLEYENWKISFLSKYPGTPSPARPRSAMVRSFLLHKPNQYPDAIIVHISLLSGFLSPPCVKASLFFYLRPTSLAVAFLPLSHSVLSAEMCSICLVSCFATFLILWGSIINVFYYSTFSSNSFLAVVLFNVFNVYWSSHKMQLQIISVYLELILYHSLLNTWHSQFPTSQT